MCGPIFNFTDHYKYSVLILLLKSMIFKKHGKGTVLVIVMIISYNNNNNSNNKQKGKCRLNFEILLINISSKKPQEEKEQCKQGILAKMGCFEGQKSTYKPIQNTICENNNDNNAKKFP